jgi:hypothetical protein
LAERVEFISLTDAFEQVSRPLVRGLQEGFQAAEREWEQTLVLAAEGVDLDRLIERAIITDRALVNLAGSLDKLAVELRQELERAVERERQLHNRPLIAGIVIGGLAILVLLGFTRYYVDRRLVSRLTGLSRSMLSIAGGELKTPLPRGAAMTRSPEWWMHLQFFVILRLRLRK